MLTVQTSFPSTLSAKDLTLRKDLWVGAIRTQKNIMGGSGAIGTQGSEVTSVVYCLVKVDIRDLWYFT